MKAIVQRWDENYWRMDQEANKKLCRQLEIFVKLPLREVISLFYFEGFSTSETIIMNGKFYFSTVYRKDYKGR